MPLSVIQSDKGTSVDPFIPINRGITDREILISITGLYFGYSWFIFFSIWAFFNKRILLICTLDYNTVEQENIPNCTFKIESDKSTYQVEIKIKLN